MCSDEQTGGRADSRTVCREVGNVDLPERAASQEHFIDLCRLLDHPTPAEADATGEDYCFEKHVKVVGSASKGSKGDYGYVDVWKRGYSRGSTSARTSTRRSTRRTVRSTSTATISTIPR
jgi:hypothetical protein